MKPDTLASILFAILFGGCCLAFLVMAIADKLIAPKPIVRPTVPMDERMPPAISRD